jgi:predicted alpha/beta-fold hydrolase
LYPEFEPLIRHSHIATIAGNFWRREIDTARFPAVRVEYRIDPKTVVVAIEHQPDTSKCLGHLVLLHGLEGSSEAGYVVSLAQEALTRGYAVHRLNMRSCGGNEHLSQTMYHSGLTSDTKFVLQEIRKRKRGPLFLVGFSLGGNVALKLAGEMGQSDLLDGVCAASTPINLASAVHAIDRPANRIYARRFLGRLKNRIRSKSLTDPQFYSVDGIEAISSIWEFDDRYTAPLFGFGTAANYYATQSADQYLHAIRIPTLVIAAKDDPLVPFEMYRLPVFDTNPALTLIAPEFGGHLGFLSRRRPRFWLDQVIMRWVDSRAKVALEKPLQTTSP